MANGDNSGKQWCADQIQPWEPEISAPLEPALCGLANGGGGWGAPGSGLALLYCRVAAEIVAFPRVQASEKGSFVLHMPWE